MSAAMNQDVVAGLVAAALAQAQIASRGLREIVIPAWPPSRRTFPNDLAGRLGRDDIFSERLLDDLETLLGMLERRIADGTHLGWEADENHVRGGYDVVHRDEETASLARCASDLEVVAAKIAEVLNAAKAMRLAGELLDG